jgi:hypothetical protein
MKPKPKAPKAPPDPFRWFDSSPEVLRLVVLMYVRFPLSLRNVEDLLFERGIDICHETVRHHQASMTKPKLRRRFHTASTQSGPCGRPSRDARELNAKLPASSKQKRGPATWNSNEGGHELVLPRALALCSNSPRATAIRRALAATRVGPTPGGPPMTSIDGSETEPSDPTGNVHDLGRETSAERLRRSQLETHKLAREQIEILAHDRNAIVLRGTEVAGGGDLYPAGVRELCSRLADGLRLQSQTLTAIMTRSAP